MVFTICYWIYLHTLYQWYVVINIQVRTRTYSQQASVCHIILMFILCNEPCFVIQQCMQTQCLINDIVNRSPYEAGCQAHIYYRWEEIQMIAID